MITTEIKINGVVFALLKIINMGEISKELKSFTEYHVEAYIPDEKSKKGILKNFVIFHHPDDGALMLLKKAIDQVLK